MKILILNWRDIKNPLAGGAEVHMHEIFRRIAAKGHNVTLLCRYYRGFKREENIDGIRVLRRGNMYSFNYTASWLYPKLQRENEYDVLIDDSNKIPFFSPLYAKTPVLAIIHHFLGKSLYKETALPLALYVDMAERLVPLVYKNTPIVTCSPSSKKDFVARGLPAKNIFLTYCGINHTVYRPSGEQNGYDGNSIVFIGRIKKYKSIEILIRAMPEVLAQLPHARLTIIGEGDALSGLQAITAQEKLRDKVTFTGYVSQSEKISYLQKAAVVVCPSIKEGWGLTVIEANACGTPVIASDVPGLKDSVRHGKTGFLFPYGDSKTLARMIISVMKGTTLRNDMSVEAVKWSRQFDWDKAATRMLELIKGNY